MDQFESASNLFGHNWRKHVSTDIKKTVLKKYIYSKASVDLLHYVPVLGQLIIEGFLHFIYS